MASKDVAIDLIVNPKRAIQGIDEVSDRADGASKFLAGLSGVAGAVLLAGVVGAAALGGAVVSSYAEYEQLAGGVTKLFGEADATVSEFAANAAQSAGLSTNQYLNTVTSFSASLISGLGGDQAKAAQVADTAITDMADNANTFGTSMDSLQTTYQSFAKGQFALLDNLKLGYGGTAEEMARLINDSGVMGDSFVATAQNVKEIPFASMVEAIHQVQTEMNITGTTAREASSTITGSFDATKASLTNLVTGLGDANADFDLLVGNLAENAGNLVVNVGTVLERVADALPIIVPALLTAVQTALPMFIDVAASLITAIIEGLVQTAPAMVAGAVPLILKLVTGLLTLLPSVITAGIQIVVAVVQGIAQALPTLIPAATSAIIDGILALVAPENLTAILGAGLALLTGLMDGILTALPILIEALPTIILGIIDFVISAIPQLIQAGIALLLGLIGALPEIISAIVTALPQIIDGVIGGILDAIPLLIQAGIELLISLITNLPQIIATIVMKMPEIITGIVTALINGLGKIVDVGWQLIQGLWQGILSAGDWLWQQISGFVDGVMGWFGDLFGIHSPSTLMRDQIGKNLGLGMAEGILDSRSEVEDAMKQLTSIPSASSFEVSSDLAIAARATVANSGGALGAGGSQVTIIVQAIAPDASVGRAVVTALQEYVRSGGTGLRTVVGAGF